MEFYIRQDCFNTDCIWATYTELGSAAYQAGDVGIAKIMFAAAKDEARRRGFCDWRWETSLRNMDCITQAEQKSAADSNVSLSGWNQLAERSTANRLRRLEELAEAYAANGRYFRAAKLYEQLIELIEEILGQTHPSIIPRMLRLAWVLGMQKKHSRALEIYSRAKVLAKESNV
jgi:tetratricopeptide (TPR) repeat protein